MAIGLGGGYQSIAAVHGEYLSQQLSLKPEQHPNVGDIRGRGLFWGVEFVEDRDTKEPFELSEGLRMLCICWRWRGSCDVLGCWDGGWERGPCTCRAAVQGEGGD